MGMSQARSTQTAKSPASSVPVTSIHKVEADGVQVFYRAAGDPSSPVVLLLHGFPASSFMFRELIPRLADDFRVIAPDLPGFGFTDVPAERNYVYSFDRLAATMNAFTQTLKLRRFALYVFDYGAPTGFRLAMAHPDRAQADASARRLHGRWNALEARGKPRLIIVVAVARELAGHCWALATME